MTLSDVKQPPDNMWAVMITYMYASVIFPYVIPTSLHSYRCISMTLILFQLLIEELALKIHY